MKCYLLALVFALNALNLHAEEYPGVFTPSKEEIQAYLKQNDAAWLAEIKKSKGNLYYNDQEWPQVIQRIETLTGPGAEIRTMFFEYADRLVRRPIVVYKTPEERVAAKEKDAPNLLIARTEMQLWGVAENSWTLALAAKISKDEKYRKKLHDIIMVACSYPTWGQDGKNPAITNNDVACMRFAWALSLAYDWFPEIFSEAEKGMIRKTIAERVPCIFNAKGKEHFASHCWRKYGTLMVVGEAFYREIPAAREWFAAGSLTYKKVANVQNPDGSSFGGLHPYGGCDFFINAIEATKQINHVDQEWYHEATYFKNFANYEMGSTTPGLKGALRWGDAFRSLVKGQTNGHSEPIMAPPTFWDAGMTDLHTVFLSASLSHNGKAQYFANQRIKQLGNDGLRGALMWYDPSVKEDPALPLDFYFPVTGIVTSRNSWEPNDYYFSFKAGLNARTHSHLEAGAFTFYSAGMWFIPTPGMGRGHQMAGYWQFEDKRADFFSPSAESVSTLIVNGKNQRFDVDAKGQITDYIASPNAVWIDSDLKDAYYDVDSIQRKVFHRRGEYLLILDDVSAPTPVKVEWLAQTLPPLTKVLGNKIMISNSESSLDLTSLDANLKFSPRAPTSKIVDIPQDEQATYALAQTGTSVQYSVLLEPRKVGATGPKIATEIDAKGKIHLRGNGWEDIISLARSKKSGDEPIEAKSSVIRMKDGKVASVVASFSTAAKLDAFEMQTATPVSWVWDGSELTFAKGFTGDFKVLDASKKLVDEKGTPIVLDKTVTLPAGRYFIRNRN